MKVYFPIEAVGDQTHNRQVNVYVIEKSRKAIVANRAGTGELSTTRP